MTEKATFKIGDQTIELPVIIGSEGEKAVDISKLRATTGCVTYDPAFGNTAGCKSTITFIDGEKGILRYRGIPIEQFVDNPDFVEAAWLLIFGRLPTEDELNQFRGQLTDHELLHDSLTHSYRHLPVDAPPMAILCPLGLYSMQ